MPNTSGVMKSSASVEIDRPIEAAYHYEALDGNRTRVTQKPNVPPKGFTKVFFFLFGWLMKKGGCEAQQRELENLKQKCEAQA